MFASTRFAAAVVSIATAAAAVGLSAPASAAPAAPFAETRSVDVRHADLDLASAAGVAKLDRRVQFAVKSVCGGLDTRDLAARERVMACRKSAAAAAQSRIEVAVAAARSDSRLARNEAAPSVQGAAN